MTATVFHLRVDADDEQITDAAWELHRQLGFETETTAPTRAEFDRLYRQVGTDAAIVEATDAALRRLWERWNTSPGDTAIAFSERECRDCDRTFDHKRHGGFRGRQTAATKHEQRTKARGDGHTVAPGTRSLMVGDAVLLDGRLFVVASVGWTEINTDWAAADRDQSATGDPEVRA